jgi:hypothetical protein
MSAADSLTGSRSAMLAWLRLAQRSYNRISTTFSFSVNSLYGFFFFRAVVPSSCLLLRFCWKAKGTIIQEEDDNADNADSEDSDAGWGRCGGE